MSDDDETVTNEISIFPEELWRIVLTFSSASDIEIFRQCFKLGLKICSNFYKSQILLTRGTKAYVFDADTMTLICKIQGIERNINCCAFSTSGERILLGTNYGRAEVFQTENGTHLFSLDTRCIDGILSCSFSSDDQLIALSDYSNSIKTFNANSGSILRKFYIHAITISCCVFSKTKNDLLLTASWDSTARINNAMTGDTINILSGHAAGLTCAAFSRDSKRIITASRDRSARMWCTDTGTSEFELQGHSLVVNCCSFSNKNNNIAVTGSDDKDIRIWCAVSGNILSILKGHNSKVRSCAFSSSCAGHDPRLLAVSQYDGSARIWDPEYSTHIALFTFQFHTPTGTSLSCDFH